ncbi:MAG: acyl carrier protein [candidate division Zixibacteria bacterium]|nr:acyl carrier protein [candidate division Zixibacteria bacterium]
MEKQKISEKVAQFIAEQFVFDEELSISNDDSLLESGTIDSTGILELVLFLEENFSMSVEDDELVPDNLDSINKIADFVARKNAA